MADQQPTDFFADPPQPESEWAPGVADAVAEPFAAENQEGAPLSDAPDADATPDQDDVQAEGEDQQEAIDWQARALAAEQRQAELDQRQAHLDAQQQAEMYRRAQAAFDENWNQHVAYAEENLGASEAVAYLTNVRNAHTQALRTYYEGAVQTVMQVAMGPSFADHLIQQHGLDPEDRALLGNDPNQMPVIAQALAAKKQRLQTHLDQTQRDLKNVKRGQQARRLVESGATRTGGGGLRAPVVDPRALSPMDHLKGLLSGRIQDR